MRSLMLPRHCYNGRFIPYFTEFSSIMDDKERSRALDLALGQIEKQFGKGSILRLGAKDAMVPVSVDFHRIDLDRLPHWA